jgi:hypothetical protein
MPSSKRSQRRKSNRATIVVRLPAGAAILVFCASTSLQAARQVNAVGSPTEPTRLDGHSMSSPNRFEAASWKLERPPTGIRFSPDGDLLHAYGKRKGVGSLLTKAILERLPTPFLFQEGIIWDAT